MARTVLNVMSLDNVNVPAVAAASASMLVAPNSADGAEFEMGKDNKTLILLVNDGSSAASAVIKAGNGIQGVADLTVNLESGKYTTLCLDSGRFKNVSGADKGKVILTGTAKVAVFQLP